MRPRKVLLIGVALTLLAAGLAPAGALAGTVSVTGGELLFTGGANQNNDLTVELFGLSYRVTDSQVALTAGAGCNQQNPHRATCAAATVTRIDFATASGYDAVEVFASTPATLDGGTDPDQLTGGSGADTLIAGGAMPFGFSETLNGAGGADELIASNFGSGANMFGGDGADTLLGGSRSDRLTGGGGPDDLRGGQGGSDRVEYGGSDPLTVTIGSGADDGAAGEGDNVRADVETVEGSAAGDLLIGTDGHQALIGEEGGDDLRGGGGDDDLLSGNGADVLRGDGGPDFLVGGFGTDRSFGGGGIDEASYSERTDPAIPIAVSLNDVANDGAPGEEDNVRSDVENVKTGRGPDTLTGNGLDNELTGGGGMDAVSGGLGDDRLFGDDQSSTGSDADDTLNGAGGDDFLRGGGGGDTFTGGADTDRADYSSSTNPLTITVGAGANDGEAGEGDDVAGDVEVVVGGSAGDNVTGGSGPDFLVGAGGTDNLQGAGGDDLLTGENPLSAFGGAPVADVLDGGTGLDTVSYHRTHGGVTVDLDGVADDGGTGTGENDNVLANVESLIGSDGNDTLTGNTAADALIGRDGPDNLLGGDGADYLAGSAGADTHEGQGGNDRINSRLDGSTDTDNCGDGNDFVVGDSSDLINLDCEDVNAP